MIVFIGFNLTFFPQFILGYLGMPRRYWQYPPEFQVLNVLSTAGSTILAIGYLVTDDVFPVVHALRKSCLRQPLGRRRAGMDDQPRRRLHLILTKLWS